MHFHCRNNEGRITIMRHFYLLLYETTCTCTRIHRTRVIRIVMALPSRIMYSELQYTLPVLICIKCTTCTCNILYSPVLVHRRYFCINGLWMQIKKIRRSNIEEVSADWWMTGLSNSFFLIKRGPGPRTPSSGRGLSPYLYINKLRPICPSLCFHSFRVMASSTEVVLDG